MVEPAAPAIAKGLEGVVVDESAISLVDGEHGQLSYRGVDVSELLEQPFDAVAWLVLQGELPSSGALEAFQREQAAIGELTDRERALLAIAADAPAHPMQVLQATVPLLERPPAFAQFGEAAQGLVIAAKLPQLLAALSALRSGAPIPAYPDTERDSIRRFLLQTPGGATPLRERALRVTQILQLEHGFNAGTFSARVTASTLAPIENCISAALGTLHGVLHGGADQAALETADEVGDPSRAAAFVDACLASGRKVMGMGHREYKVLDPRAKYVKALADELATTQELRRTYETLASIEARFRERMAEKGKPLYANLEFYKGPVYRALGLPTEFFTAAFAMSRVYGYVAHFIESRRDNRIIRPSAHYVGKRPAAAATPA
jgi:citrate synthase